MKCEHLFSEKKSKQLPNMSSAEYAHTVVKVKGMTVFFTCFWIQYRYIYI